MFCVPDICSIETICKYWPLYSLVLKTNGNSSIASSVPEVPVDLYISLPGTRNTDGRLLEEGAEDTDQDSTSLPTDFAEVRVTPDHSLGCWTLLAVLLPCHFPPHVFYPFKLAELGF